MSLVVDSGPVGAVLSGAIEPVVGGVARFGSFRAKPAGTYRLRALSGGTGKLGDVDIVVSVSPDRIFEEGFEGRSMVA